jgi:serine/threonine protein kinase
MGTSDILVYVPNSELWTAPEYHHRGFNISSAKRMDVYSFGMLCLWLLFQERFSTETTVWKTQCPDASNLITLGDSREIRFQEGEDSLRNWAGKFIDTSGLFNREIQNNLKAFFNSALAGNPEERLTDWEYLIHLLQDTAVTAEYAASNRCAVQFTINHE